MPLSIKNHDVEKLARELSRRTGETLTEVILKSLQERLQRIRRRTVPVRLADQIDEIARRCAALPELDHRSEDEILGYDEQGLPR